MKLLKFIELEKKYLVFIFFVALIVRLIYIIPLSPEKLSPDAYDWMGIAWSIATGHGWGDTWRPPGYAAWLGTIFFIFGKSILIVRIINSILGSLTCVIIYFIGKKIFSSTVGKIAAFLLSFYPYLIAYTGDLLSETFYTFLISVSILYVIICSENPSFKNIMIGGILIGITGLTKSTILPFFLFACVWLWWVTKNLKTGFLVGIFTLITISPWTVRNHLYCKKVIPVSTPWLSFYGSTCDEALYLETIGEHNTPMTDEMVAPAIPKGWEYIMKLPPAERNKICKQKALKWLKNSPQKFFWLIKKRLIHFWRLYPTMAYKWQKRVAMVTSGIYIPLCFVGIILSIRNFRKTSLLIFLFIIYTLVHLFFVVVLRYRIPIDPYIIIFASYTINFFLLKLQINNG